MLQICLTVVHRIQNIRLFQKGGKRKLLLVSVLGILFLSSCAHHHKDAGGHHHHKCKMKSCSMMSKDGAVFSKHCAMSVSMGDIHVEGKKEYMLEHGGETYYFSTKEKMKTFEKNVEINIQRAKDHWNHIGERR